MASFGAGRAKVEAAVLQKDYGSKVQNERSKYRVRFIIKLGETKMLEKIWKKLMNSCGQFGGILKKL